ncbi:hypothetical protein DN069_20820 [Streptacidiphilus pinicola]|uniref:FAD-dependent urate hydroxylase HpyO/Asp monooxygenase CreE-like FAD/NAD(P)-binding domain-containing protein n=1 Tax=Streptacidiphilus pinicola TaxID=2219663 RepID=A0A2X0K838_9ACTN|nr:FAD/NAD(P)-binding protein [Streptacidiphilus pinicola]RAG83699.1 hypothetical protein DN069_20820 [Streptacidiphilus pinicola]
MSEATVICIVGAGPMGSSVLERICSGAAVRRDWTGKRLDIHIVDPYVVEGGSIWRSSQDRNLWMNTLPDSVGLFTDETVECDGPINPGPTLWQWIEASREADRASDQAREKSRVSKRDRWPARFLMGEYITWFRARAAQTAPDWVRVIEHRAKVLDITRGHSPGRPEHVWLSGRKSPLECDRVVLAQGNLPVLPDGNELAMCAQASNLGASYVHPRHVVDESFDHVRAGASLLLRGLGLSFIDQVQVLTVGRGGKFVRTPEGRLTYAPSGREPRLFATSRSGVPLGPVPVYKFDRPPLLPDNMAVTDKAVRAALGEPATAFERLTLLIVAEIELSYLREISSLAGASESAWQSQADSYLLQMRETGELPDTPTCPRVNDEPFTPRSFDKPMAGQSFESTAALQDWMIDYISGSIKRVLSPASSPQRAMLRALSRSEAVLRRHYLQSQGEAAPLVRSLQDLRHKRQIMAGGPPWPRLEQLIALCRAGVLTFLGPSDAFEFVPEAGMPFRLTPSALGRSFGFLHAVESRIPAPGVENADDSLRSRMWERGEIIDRSFWRTGSTGRAGLQYLTTNGDGNPLSATGEYILTRHVVGGNTSVVVPPGLPRVRTNSGVLRFTDRVAQALLRSLEDPTSE